jgi:hypothetical protein
MTPLPYFSLQVTRASYAFVTTRGSLCGKVQDVQNWRYSQKGESRAGVVGIATGYGLDDWGVRVQVSVGSRIFSTSSRPALGLTQPPSQWVAGAFSPGIKRPGREADHSPTTSAEVKKIWIYTSTPPYALME